MGRSRHVSRRRFLKGSALASASALSILPAAKSAPSQQSQRQPSRVSTFFDLIRPPDFITAYENAAGTPLSRSNEVWSGNGITVKLHPTSTSPRGLVYPT